MSVYQAQIVDRNSHTVDSDGGIWNVTAKTCGHRHRTISGALRCLRGLQYFDRRTQTYNDWERFGGVYDATGGVSRCLSGDDEETLEALQRAGR